MTAARLKNSGDGDGEAVDPASLERRMFLQWQSIEVKIVQNIQMSVARAFDA